MDFDLEYDYEEALERQKIDNSDIELLRKSIADIDVIPKTLTNKQLLLFFDSNNKNIETAKKVLKLYYEARKSSPEHFGNRDPISPEIQQCLENQDYFFFKKPTANGSSVIFHRLSSKKSGDYHIDEAIRTFFMTIDSCLNTHGPRNSVIFLFDMKNVSLSHLTRVKIGSIRKFFYYLQECLPAQLNSIHVLNTVSFIDRILTLIRPFMKAEILKNLHLHSASTMDKEKFYRDVIPLEDLPEDLGGNLDSIADLHSAHIQEFLRLRGLFLAEKLQRSQNEPEDLKKKEVANVESLRNLCID